MNYGRKEDFQKIRTMDVSMNDSIIIFRTGEITIAEKVSSVCPKAWLELATGSYASYSWRHRAVSFFRSAELTYVGLFCRPGLACLH